MGVGFISDLLFGAHIRALDFWKLPHGRGVRGPMNGETQEAGLWTRPWLFEGTLKANCATWRSMSS